MRIKIRGWLVLYIVIWYIWSEKVENGERTESYNAQWIAPYLSDKLKDWLERANRNELPAYKGGRGRKFCQLMKASDTWDEFDKLFKKAMGEPVQLELDISEDK